MEHSYVGKRYTDEDVAAALQTFLVRIQIDGNAQRQHLPRYRKAARRAARDRLVSGRAPSSARGRSAIAACIADPRKPEMKDILNSRVKHRQPFRPFAPIVLAERVKEIFEGEEDSPFMLIAKRSVPNGATRFRRSSMSTAPRGCRPCAKRPIRCCIGC